MKACTCDVEIYEPNQKENNFLERNLVLSGIKPPYAGRVINTQTLGTVVI